MEYAEFDQSKKKILFFCRGRGRGHAIVDIEIANAVGRLSNDVDLRFVSHGTGASTLAAHGISHIDLHLPDRNPINETIVLAGQLIGWLQPDLVVTHEEFSALPAARIFDRPTILITDWFTDPWALSMGSLRLADRIIFLDEYGIYPEPPWVEGKVHYIGPVIRNFQYRVRDRALARDELGLARDALVLAVLPGSWLESELPIVEPVLAMFDSLEHDPRHLLWVAGTDEGVVREAAAGRGNVSVFHYEPEIDRIMVAADVAITKGNRKTLMELHHLGLPSVSISNGANPIDHLRAGRFPNNRMLPAEATAGEIDVAVRAALRSSPDPAAESRSDSVCAELILESFARLGQS